MYELTCPCCEKSGTYWEPEGMINCYVPLVCEHCDKIFYILHRSWFDPYYDNSNVEIRTIEWTQRKRKQLKKAGKFDDGKHKADIYYPKWDIYKKVGGRKQATKVVKELLNTRDE